MMKKIIRNLKKINASYKKNGKLYKVTTFIDQLPEKCEIKVNNRYFRLLSKDYELGYFYGLSFGSRYSSSKEFILSLELLQFKRVKSFLDKYDIKYKYKTVKRKRKKYNSKPSPFYYQKIILTIFAKKSFEKYLKAFDIYFRVLNLSKVNDEMKIGIITGLFDSKRTNFNFRNNKNGIHERITLDTTDLNVEKEFLNALHGILKAFGIHSTTSKDKLRIYGKDNLTLFFKIFNLSKIKAIALKEVLQLRCLEPCFTKIINYYPINNFDLTILGYILHKISKNNTDIRIFEILRAFRISCNMVRKSLYKLNEFGFINYYKDKVNREFISFSDKVVTNTVKELKRRLREQEKLEEENLLECSVCGRIFKFIECFDFDFQCPKCGCKDLINPKTKVSIQTKRVLTEFINSILLKSNNKRIKNKVENFCEVLKKK
ncbi:MAG: hypothetical protein GF329_16220 [Candidatus Lokiarchaeota archaeon]|nr:hypothetical protein [Candidatus Lokiarchaeota archaeon]